MTNTTLLLSQIDAALRMPSTSIQEADTRARTLYQANKALNEVLHRKNKKGNYTQPDPCWECYPEARTYFTQHYR